MMNGFSHRALTPVTTDINTGTLDLTGAAPPPFHIDTQNALPWPETADALSRCRQGQTHQRPPG